MSYWTRFLLPSLNAVNVTREDVEGVAAPVLIVHGLKDRSAPIGGGRDWARMLPDARLLAIDNGGHGPWIEAPDLVIGAIERFLGGDWPPQASLVAPEPTVSS
jgi:pimeloyl-ACP methyl ester carboxylesterase